MSIIFALLFENFFIILPSNWVGWVGLVAWFGVIVSLLIFWKRYQKPLVAQNRLLFVGLLILVPVTSIFIGTRLPTWDTLPLPEVVLEPGGLPLMFFSAVPWVLAAGLFGPLIAAILAASSGLMLAVWGSHSLYTVVEIAFLAILFSVFQNQNYRTRLFKSIRHPILASFVVWLLYPILFLINSIFFTSGSLAGQIDYAFSNVTAAMIVIGGPLLIAALLATIIKNAFPGRWGGQPPWQPAPTESSLEARFLRSIIPLASILVLILMVGDWLIAGDEAQKILQDRMSSVAQSAVDGVPYFLNTGQSLIQQIAQEVEPALISPIDLDQVLQIEMRAFPFFNQLFVLDQELNALGGYPASDFYTSTTSMDELAGLNMALEGVDLQSYSLPPAENESTVMITFIAAIKDEDEIVQGVLVGRADVLANPLTKPILTTLRGLEAEGGSGFLVDENGMILFHPDSNRLGKTYPLSLENDGLSYQETAPDGTRQITYLKSAVGRPWSVVVTYPAAKFQQLALDIAMPLLGIVILISIVAVISIRLGLRSVTASLKSLAIETDRIAKGQLHHALQLEGEDEVGQLGRSFEKMRVSLKDRLDELNRLLEVSQGVATSLEMTDVVRPILESALVTGASSARIVLTKAVLPKPGIKSEVPSRFGLGDLSNTYSRFDDQFLILMEDQGRIVLTNPARTTLLNVPSGLTRPEALLSIALRHETQFYGAFWIAFDSPHVFTREEVHFMTTLASHAALAAAKTRLFWTAEYGRQRLEAILASSPDPIIVTDHENQLLLVNPVALKVFNLDPENWVGKNIEDVIPRPALVNLLRSPLDENQSVEVSLPDHRFYTATTSPILVEKSKIGTVCVLRDITHYKQLDDLKSEFVSTVSHDLRSPLTLIRGYTTMLGMVGKLNEQQEGYVQKIVDGVESMSQLISNLLDLGRIEANIGLKIEKLSVKEVLDQLAETFRLPASQKQLKLNIDLSKLTSPIIEADRSMLEQAFNNLLENAVKFTPTGNDIWVRVSNRKDRILIEFQDTGIGISSVDIPRLFEKFYRSTNREAKKQSGTGLGLAIVKSIADRHGGRVWAESKLGKGSTFFFEIPIQQSTTSYKNLS